MKQTLIALAALAAVGAASAQSTVTIKGLVGAAYQSVDSNGINLTDPSFASGKARAYRGFALTDATLNFGVVEDLGGGLKAEASLKLDSVGSSSTANYAQPLQRRDTSIGLSSSMGTLSFQSTRTGRMLARGMVAPANLANTIYDNSGIIARFSADVVQYATPSISGFTGFAQWVEPAVSNTSFLVLPTSMDGYATPVVAASSVGFNYVNGPLEGGMAYKANRGLYTNSIRTKSLEGFLTYDLGSAKLGFGYDSAVAGTIAANTVADSSAYSLGVAAPLGAVVLGANWAKRDVNTVSELVVKYDLSKRTNFNASLGKHSADADPTGVSGIDGRQYRLGVNHAF